MRNFLTPDVNFELTSLTPAQLRILGNIMHIGGGWKGADEFARDRSRQSFERNYLPRLKEWAPKGPFEFALAPTVQLPEYDAKRGGFALGKIGIKDEFPDNFGLISDNGHEMDPPVRAARICFCHSTRRAPSVCSISLNKPPPVNKPWATMSTIEWCESC